MFCQYKKYDQQIALRRLFTDHAVYTRFFIESALKSLPDTDAITKRLLQNQEDIGDAVGSDKLTELLKQHIMAAAGAVSAVKSNDKSKVDSAVKKVFANSKKVSRLISSLNPSKLPYDVVLEQFNKHNQYVIDMTVLLHQGKYSQGLKLYDEYFDHMMMFSDTLNNALAKYDYTSWYWLLGILAVLIIILLILYYNRYRIVREIAISQLT